ncbi:Uncharacterized membrane-anchored protein YitT, contains DUF161 and DUF2179 domains [Desulfonispora thiosulfatigenes DSM 11270]|uniref:Uncharacterized membrane-anchored protein YitT, contains DUF161 and DUF2179 domains n=1 Tax=Desulfonispora thiosulfatigenes DSM 11270 TaxID=656914 RepID=A0A1W1V7F2_DESTI|nr:YitT family protein [Desulfonispora thiosulfatigenes]SMB89367.1 Uncharacterized membrane-anchored protein YitT, contains DUF161 and DUF2179 domains [Desulfonispora thiosulfatigenes DSM 11270]
MSEIWKQQIRDILIIYIGTLIFAFGVNYFIIANNLAEGGFTGIALICHYKLGWSLSSFIFWANVPLLLLAWKLWGWEFISKTVLGVVFTSLNLELTSGCHLIVDDLLLAALFGGVLTGTGIGLVLRYGGTTGGSDIIGRVFNKFFGLKMGRFYLIFDFIVLSAVGFFFGLTVTLYSLVIIFVFSKITDYILEGIDSANQVLIFSSKNESIGEKIKTELHRGITYIEGQGGFTGTKNDLLLCVVGKWQIFRLKKLVKEIDPGAFVIVSEVYEALGEGFKDTQKTI